MKFAPVIAALAIVLAGCGGGDPESADSTAASSVPRCYELLEGTSRAVIRIAATPSPNDSQGGEITVYSYVDGVEEFAPETTAGRLETDAFVYGDGTRLALTDATLTWPQDSLLEGAVFTATPCP